MVIQTTCGMLFFCICKKFGVIAKIFFINQLENNYRVLSLLNITQQRDIIRTNELDFVHETTKTTIMSQKSSNDYLSVIYTGSIVLFTLALKGEREL